MVLRCILCGIYKKKGSNISLHSIPKDPVLRKRWIEACKLHKFLHRPPDRLNLVKICSAHFDSDSYIPENNSGRPRLRPNAIPRIKPSAKQRKHGSTFIQPPVIEKSPKQFFIIDTNVTNNSCIVTSNDTSVIENFSYDCDTEEVSKNFEIKEALLHDQDGLEIGMTQDVEAEQNDNPVLQNLDRDHTAVKLKLLNQEYVFSLEREIEGAYIAGQDVEPQLQHLPQEQSNHEIEEDLHVLNDISMATNEEESDFYNESTERLTCTATEEVLGNDNDEYTLSDERKIWRPARITQLTEEHFATPKRRKLHLSLTRKKFEEQKKIIRKLKEQNKRLLNKIENFFTLVAKLTNKQLITVNAAKVLVYGKTDY